MLTLYYSKGSSPLAAHILLEEVGASFKLVEISIPNGEHLSPAFLKLNPKGRVPALQTPQGLLTENPAILEYIAATHPDAGLLPQEVFPQAQARALASYICATAHVAFAHKLRGARWADEVTSISDMQNVVPRNLRDCADFLETDLALAPWAMGQSYSFCDPYLFLLGRWLSVVDVPLDTYPKLAAHYQAVLARPATQTALAAQGLD